jgi:hypothetical protein
VRFHRHSGGAMAALLREVRSDCQGTVELRKIRHALMSSQLGQQRPVGTKRESSMSWR